MSAPSLSRDVEGASLIMSLLSTSFVAWLLIGASAYGDDSFIPVEALPLFTGLLSTIFVVCLIFATAELQTARPGRSGVYYTAAIMGFGVSASYSLISSGWANAHHRIFWALGGTFGGLLLETLTGFCAFCARWLQASISHPEPETGISRAAKKRQ
ncbi:hypothetical protein EsH8_III_000246 [Colletotrichum jinshuiense]